MIMRMVQCCDGPLNYSWRRITITLKVEISKMQQLTRIHDLLRLSVDYKKKWTEQLSAAHRVPDRFKYQIWTFHRKCNHFGKKFSKIDKKFVS